jgi:PhnB protein
MLMRFKDAPDPSMCSPGSSEKVMHASFRIGDSLLMASDGRCTGKMNFDGFSLSLGVATEAEAQKAFAALSAGGTVQMPLSKTFFSPCFGMVADQFGITWMVLVTAPVA